MLDITGTVAMTGDWHMNKSFVTNLFSQFTKRHPELEYIINCGDMCYWHRHDLDWLNTLAEENNTPIYWIDGNHDNHELLNNLSQDGDNCGIIGPWVKYIPRGTMFMLNGHRTIALGGTASVGKNRNHTPWSDGEIITEADVEKALSHGSADIMITHEAPYGMKTLEARILHSCHKFPPHEVAESLYQRVKIRQLVETLEPQVIYHGHHHHRYTETLKLRSGQEVLSVGLGRDGDHNYHITSNFVILNPHDSLPHIIENSEHSTPARKDFYTS